ncbi:hypothetical protein [Aureispira anguillae]|uniref:Uncharacterized protein n=1 Tax=Aureispira anguillae TaxID=2864201 RepID=A0A915YLU9_9BACT|nr:hypothetical protein [Aureispira anguillae]BDS15598.1 hypothetical protein AsAng_0063820 [Aureispira anguillae]
MSDLSNGLPKIINDKTNFSCFLGFVKGTIEATVYDNGTDQFPTHINVDSNLGSGGITLTLEGNQTINKEFSGVKIIVTISNWSVSPSQLSFHVKAEAKKGIFSCQVFDRTLKGRRHNKAMFEQTLADTLNKAEAAKNS